MTRHRLTGFEMLIRVTAAYAVALFLVISSFVPAVGQFASPDASLNSHAVICLADGTTAPLGSDEMPTKKPCQQMCCTIGDRLAFEPPASLTFAPVIWNSAIAAFVTLKAVSVTEAVGGSQRQPRAPPLRPIA